MTRLPVIFDIEGFQIRQSKRAPELVCASWLFNEDTCGLLDASDAIRFFGEWVSNPDLVIVGHNIAFDMCVMAEAQPLLLPWIFQAYADNRITCTKVREQLLNLADGRLNQGKLKLESGTVNGYSLAGLVHKYHRVDLSSDKAADAWVMRYHTLAGVPLAEWPREARDYPVNDVKWTGRIYHKQDERTQGRTHNPLKDQHHQARAAFALALIEAWGIRTDGQAVESLAQTCESRLLPLFQQLQAMGVMRPDETIDTAMLQSFVKADYESRGLRVPMTAPSKKFLQGQVKTDHDTLLESSHPVLNAYADVLDAKHTLSNFVPLLRSAAAGPLHTSYRTLLETGRTSSSPNVQNPPRKGKVRECVVPREGYYFCSSDFAQQELVCLGQLELWMLGKSTMAEAINKGKDLHLALGAQILGVSYDECERRYKAKDPAVCDKDHGVRQQAKGPNFGFPGALGIDGFIAYMKNNYNTVVDKGTAQQLKRAWHLAWPEKRDYFRVVKEMFDGSGTPDILQIPSGRVRGQCFYTAACNGLFQGLASDCSKQALFDVAWECYAKPHSWLYGTRPAVFLHDEILAEVPISRAHEAANRLADVMREAMSKWVPDMRVVAEPALMERWYKNAGPVFSDGRLVPWQPEVKAA